MRSLRARAPSAERSPTKEATTWRVCRHKAIHTQRGLSLDPTKLQSSSSANTSPFSAGRSVSLKGGKLPAFSEPLGDGLPGNAEDPLGGPQAPKLDFHRPQDQLLALGIGGGTFGNEHLVCPTRFAEILLGAARVVAAFDNGRAATVRAKGLRLSCRAIAQKSPLSLAYQALPEIGLFPVRSMSRRSSRKRTRWPRGASASSEHLARRIHSTLLVGDVGLASRSLASTVAVVRLSPPLRLLMAGWTANSLLTCLPSSVNRPTRSILPR